MTCAKPGPMHWEDLRSHPRDEILARQGVTPAQDGLRYQVTFLNAVYLVDPVLERIVEVKPDPQRVLSEEFQIMLIRYMVARLGGPPEGAEISEKDLPGGVTFFQGPHALHVQPIVNRYGKAADAFAARGLELGAEMINYGDKGLRFHPFPEIPVSYILWAADEEFPASVSVLFDRSIQRWFDLDMVFMIVFAVTERIMGR